MEKALYVKRKMVVMSEDILDGKDYSFSRLSPSHSDRGPYFSLIVEGLSPSKSKDDEATFSIQRNTKRIFDKQIKVR